LDEPQEGLVATQVFKCSDGLALHSLRFMI